MSQTKQVIWLLLLTISAAVNGQDLPADFEQKVEELVNIFLRENRSPAIGLAVVQSDGRFSFTRGYGTKDIENNLPATEQSLFAIASISKVLFIMLYATVNKSVRSFRRWLG